MILHEAVRAAQRGMAVFPVEPLGKTPHRLYPRRSPEDAPWTIKWSEVATTDLNQIVFWFQGWSPQANYGIAAKSSGLLVVDCDQPKTGRELKGTPYAYIYDHNMGTADGYDVFREMCIKSGGDWDSTRRTRTVGTGSGGLHFYYNWPSGLQASQASLMPGLLDIRCNGGTKGGYVLGPGSVTDKGPYAVEDDLPVIDCPPWLIERCRDRPVAPKVKPVYAGGVVQPGRAGGSFDGLVNSVLYAGAGNVNFTLHWAACCMRDDGATEDQAVELLAPPYVLANGRGGQRQAEQTINSAFRR